MNPFYLNVPTNNQGGYLSSEQIDLLKIINCNSYQEIITFVSECAQLNGLFKEEEIKEFTTKDLEQLKRFIFKTYQNTLVPHTSDPDTIINNTLIHLNITDEDIDIIKKAYQKRSKEGIKYICSYLKNRYPKNYEEILKHVHRFISIERDQNQDSNLYDELLMLNEILGEFNTLLIGSGRPEVIINEFFEDENQRYDFYFAKRDLDFALKNNKHVRFHSLLTKEACESLFAGKTKDEILKILTNYVKRTIDFINEYNSTHKLTDGTPVINAVDLLNEIVSFDKNTTGEYENIWESNYGISIKDICEVFDYAKKHKPEGVSFLYNEPFLEDAERRKKVFEVLLSLNSTSNGLIDTLGSQMHITFGTALPQIISCFNDFKYLQDTEHLKIQITEFDLSLSEAETLKTIGDTPKFTHEQVYEAKKELIADISTIINHSQVQLNGISYWSLTDITDCNLERIRTNLLKKGLITNIDEIKTVCGGLIPTYYITNIMTNTNSAIHK